MGIDFGGAFKQAGLEFEQQAANQFGQAVDQFSHQPLTTIFGEALGGSLDTVPNTPQPGYWNATGYADDLIKYQPKHRFLFRVLIDTDPSFAHLIPGRKETFQYMIKQIDRPKLNFEYEEVNMYNFNTKVLKRIHHEAVTITFIDDIQNSFHNFFRSLLMAHSPISRSWNESQSLQQLEEGGFNFQDAPNGGADSAGRGVLADGKINPLRTIKLIQYFGHGSAENTFVFVNPRIIDFALDEVSYDGGDQGNHATMRFEYDALYIENQKLTTGRSDYAAPGTDLYNSIENDYLSSSDPAANDFGLSNVLGSGLNRLLNASSGIVGNSINNVAAGVLGGISNPILRGGAKSIVYSISKGATQTTKNTLFGAIGNSPNNTPTKLNLGNLTNPYISED